MELDNYCAALRYAFAQNAFADAALVLQSLGGLVLDSEAFFEFTPSLRSALQRKNLPRKTQATFLLALAQLLRLRQPIESLDAATRAYDLFRRAGNELDAAYAAWFFAGAQLRAHGAVRPDVEPMLLEALETAKNCRDRHLAVGVLRNLAYLRSESGRNDDARSALAEAVEVVDRSDVAMLTSLLGSSALEEFRAGNVDNAIGLWRQAASLSEEARPSYASLCFTNVGLGELTRGDSMSARVMLRKGLAGLRSAGHNYGIAVTLDHFARLAVKSGDPKRAARIAGFSQGVFQNGPLRASLEQRLFDELIRGLRHELEPDDFEREWNRGTSMNLEDAINEAYTA
jgi:tetratricopeptide (TPR) repeat protein